MKPVFVVFEGLDGSGKTGISRQVASAIGAEWASTPAKELSECRKIADNLFKNCGRAAQLFYAATVVHASAYAAERLRENKSVVIDRYAMSTLAYDKSVRNSGLDDSFWVDGVFSGLQVPHLVIYLDVPAEIREDRMKKSRGDWGATDRASVTKADNVHKRYCALFDKFRSLAQPWQIVTVKNERGLEECVEECLEKIRQFS